MSYASGFMIGTSIGKPVYDLFHHKQGKAAAAAAPAGTFRSQAQAAPKREKKVPRFTCVSVLKGRRRYRAADVIGNKALAEMIETKVGQLPGIQFIQVNTLTGSILVYGHTEGVLDQLENFFRFRLFPTVVTGIVSFVNDVEEKKKQVTTYLKAAQSTASTFSDFIYQKTKAMLNLPTLAALILTIRGLRKTVLLGQRPSGPQMLWWAYSLLRGHK